MMDGWPFWLRLTVGCPLMILILLVDCLFVIMVCGPRND
jgi:hypothetical protein